MHDGDKITIDATARTIDWLVDEETKAQRLKEWKAVAHPLKVQRGVLLRYARDVHVRTFISYEQHVGLMFSGACERWGILRLN